MTRTFSFKADRSGDAFDGGPTGGIFQGDQDVDVGENITGFTQFTFDGIDTLGYVDGDTCVNAVEAYWNRAEDAKWPPIDYTVFKNTVSPAFDGTAYDAEYGLSYSVTNLSFNSTYYVGVRATNDTNPSYSDTNTTEKSFCLHSSDLVEILNYSLGYCSYYFGYITCPDEMENALGCDLTTWATLGTPGYFEANFGEDLANYTGLCVYVHDWGYTQRLTIDNWRNYVLPNEWEHIYETDPIPNALRISFQEPRQIHVRLYRAWGNGYRWYAGQIQCIKFNPHLTVHE